MEIIIRNQNNKKEFFTITQCNASVERLSITKTEEDGEEYESSFSARAVEQLIYDTLQEFFIEDKT